MVPLGSALGTPSASGSVPCQEHQPSSWLLFPARRILKAWLFAGTKQWPKQSTKPKWKNSMRGSGSIWLLTVIRTWKKENKASINKKPQEEMQNCSKHYFSVIKEWNRCQQTPCWFSFFFFLHVGFLFPFSIKCLSNDVYAWQWERVFMKEKKRVFMY